MTHNLRTIEKQVGDEWTVCRMYDIKQGDVFRYTDESRYVYTADRDAYVDDGVWGVVVDITNIENEA